MSLITVERKILEKNDAIAALNRKLFHEKGLFAVNLVSSPGSGKTSLIEESIRRLKSNVPMSVIEGDCQTNLDAERIDALEVPVVQIVTNGGCHLDAMLVRDAFEKLKDLPLKLLIIENVGNLVCPAAYDLGEDMKVLIMSVTEGDDKALKYPAMFRNSQVLIINKIDLLPYLDSNPETIKKNALSINPELKIFETSCKSGEGIENWCTFLTKQMTN